MAQPQAPSLDITLYPHRSLSSYGLKVVLAAVVISNLIVAAFFLRIGGWPVFGFLGLDVALVFAAFAVNARRSQGHEQIIVEGDHVTFIRVTAKGQSQREFNRRWMRVELEWDEPRELIGRLFLVSHGKRSEVGRFLGAEERKALAARLRKAMA